MAPLAISLEILLKTDVLGNSLQGWFELNTFPSQLTVGVSNPVALSLHWLLYVHLPRFDNLLASCWGLRWGSQGPRAPGPACLAPPEPTVSLCMSKRDEGSWSEQDSKQVLGFLCVF